jgi:hypothetical protein
MNKIQTFLLPQVNSSPANKSGLAYRRERASEVAGMLAHVTVRVEKEVAGAQPS